MEPNNSNKESTLKKRPLPSFIKKLWFILNDSSSQEYIFWVDNGQVICVPNAITFSKVILPRFFKHSNWQSFVRQLNLYGFRKVYQLSLSCDDSTEKRTVWQFKHDCFKKDTTERLCEIKRRTSRPMQPLEPPKQKSRDDPENSTDDPEVIKKLSEFSDRLNFVDKKRKELWDQTVELSRIQLQQQKAVEVLMDFIMQLLDKIPSSESDKQTFSKIRQTIMALHPAIDYDQSPDLDTMTTQSPLPSPPPTDTALPSISSLMTDHIDHILPPMQKRHSFKSKTI